MSHEQSVHLLDDEQFAQLIQTLGSEPTFSIWSGMFWVSAASFLAGLAALIVALYERQHSKAGADAELLLRSFDEYQGLYESLREIPKLERDYSELLSKLPEDMKYDASCFELFRDSQIDPKRWGLARKTKIYFQSRFELSGKGFFSDAAIAKTMDHAGVNLVRNQLRRLDVAMFYQTRLAKHTEQGFPVGYLERTFAEGLGWYEEIPPFMKKHKTTFGWD